MKRARVKPVALLSLFFLFFSLAVTYAFVGGEQSSGTETSGTMVFLDPPNVLDESLQTGSTFTVNVNVSEVNDLFAWQVNMSWNPLILNVTNVTFGNFLAGQPEGTNTGLGHPAIFLDNKTGAAMFAETTLGNYPGVNGNGWLASIEFLVVGYGSTDLNINSTRTLLLNNPLLNIEFTAQNGYFSNKIPGDIDGDRDVDPDDFYIFSGAYGTSPASNPECDLDRDGDVDPDDFYIFAGNYGKSV